MTIIKVISKKKNRVLKTEVLVKLLLTRSNRADLVLFIYNVSPKRNNNNKNEIYELCSRIKIKLLEISKFKILVSGKIFFSSKK